MSTNQIVFIGGLHRSGTTILHNIIGAQPQVSAFKIPGVTKNEGQYLQTVVKKEKDCGGVGKLALNQDAHLTEKSVVNRKGERRQLLEDWTPHWNPEKKIWLEKTPFNILKMRYLQELFPEAKFINLIRHPIAVSYASKKWTKTTMPNLLKNWIAAHEIYKNDLPYITTNIEIRYENFAENPLLILSQIEKELGIDINYDGRFKNKNKKLECLHLL